jgi:hypothetical protein
VQQNPVLGREDTFRVPCMGLKIGEVDVLSGWAESRDREPRTPHRRRGCLGSGRSRGAALRPCLTNTSNSTRWMLQGYYTLSPLIHITCSYTHDQRCTSESQKPRPSRITHFVAQPRTRSLRHEHGSRISTLTRLALSHPRTRPDQTIPI